MKKIISFTIVLAFLCLNSSAKIWRVNNIPGVSADYTTPQLANDNVAVVDGDTIHIEPSITNYGNLTVSKRLTVISIGDFLPANPGVEYSPITGTITNLIINNVSASGSVFHCNMSSGGTIGNANNLRFERCRMQAAISFNISSNNILLNNYLYAASFTNSNSNVISNNIFSYYLSIAATASATVVNNVFFAELAAASQAMQNSTFQNNIINKLGSFTFTNSIVENNLASNTSLPAGGGNVNSVSMASVFVNPNGAVDTAFRLQTVVANPAQGAGVAGVDCGAYGGTSPFKPGLQAAIPAIYKLSAPAAPTGNTMNVTFSTRSNN